MKYFKITVTNIDALTVAHIKTQGTISALTAALISVALCDGLDWNNCFEFSMNHDTERVWNIKASYRNSSAATEENKIVRYHLKAVEITDG